MMRKFLVAGFGLVALGGIWFAQDRVSGQGQVASAGAAGVRIDIQTPTVPEHRAVHALIKDDATLAVARDFFSLFRLPQPITFVTRSCTSRWGGAWYRDGVVTICYEYLVNALDNARSEKRPDWVSEDGALRGQIADVFIHEGAHALFEFFKTPLMGREEDAADQFATFVILHLFGRDAPNMIRGIAYSYLVDAEARTFSDLPSLAARVVPSRAYGGAHSTPLQRMFSIVCHASGFDADAYADLVKQSELPTWRAGNCEDEYKQLSHAFHTLLGPHIDRDKARAMFPAAKLVAGD